MVRASRCVFSFLLLCGSILLSASPASSRSNDLDPNQLDPKTREEILKILKPVDPVTGSRFLNGRKVAIDSVGNAAGFYTAVGVAALSKCYAENDPIYCKEYAKQLKDGPGYASFIVFTGTSMATSSGIGKIMMKSSPLSRLLVSNYGGMAFGAFTSSAVDEIYHMPETAQLTHLGEEYKDSADREKMRDQLIHSIAQKTFQNPKWWAAHGPELGSMLIAAALSQATAMAIDTSAKRAAKIFEAKGWCGTSNVLQRLITPEEGKGVGGFTRNRAREMAQLLMFMGWQNNVTDPLLRNLKLGTVDHVKLQRARAALFVGEQAPPSSTSSTSSPLGSHSLTSLPARLAENHHAWEDYRKALLQPIESVMLEHASELNDLDRQLQKTHLYYHWMETGAKDDATWESLRKCCYQPNSLPSDAKKDLPRYLHAYYFGVEPGAAIHDSIDFHGIPLPGHVSTTSEPYRVVYGYMIRPNASDEELFADISSGEHHFQEIRATADFNSKLVEVREKQIRAYQQQVEKQLLRTLTAENSSGLINSVSVQLNDLSRLKAMQTDPDQVVLIDEEIHELVSERGVMLALVNYFKTPFNERVNAIPPEGADAYLASDWAKMRQYYKSYILR